ncbi:hypothetical protein [Psychromonas sp. SP041]|uniref:hypothetical protein n=1 Tax=Psychromonas sp. SP041 TaxID=1365007 RepID=UPI00041F5762|nr:hypothetical protein [Psychromonas sp. SP041]
MKLSQVTTAQLLNEKFASFYSNLNADIKNDMLEKHDIVITGDRKSVKTYVTDEIIKSMPAKSALIPVSCSNIVDDADFTFALKSASSHTLRSISPESSDDTAKQAKSPSEQAPLTEVLNLIKGAFTFNGFSHVTIAISDVEIINKKESNILKILNQLSENSPYFSFVFCQQHNKTPIDWHCELKSYSAIAMDINEIKIHLENKYMVNMTDDVFVAVCNTLSSNYDAISQVFSALMINSNNSPSWNDCASIIVDLVKRNENAFISRLQLFSPRQKTALKAISYARNFKIFNEQTTIRFNMRRQSLFQTISNLEDKNEIIKIKPGSYQHQDALFGLWLSPAWQDDPMGFLLSISLN